MRINRTKPWRRRTTAALIVSAVGLAAGPAYATGTIYCQAPENDASVTLTIGSVPGLAVVGAVIDADGRTWQYQQAIPDVEEVAVSQAAQIGPLTAVDFVDENYERRVLSIRIVTAEEGDLPASAGVLTVHGAGSWAMICSGK